LIFVFYSTLEGKVGLLFLPPDYNPIEKSWAHMKRFLHNNLKDFQSVIAGVYDYFGLIDT